MNLRTAVFASLGLVVVVARASLAAGAPCRTTLELDVVLTKDTQKILMGGALLLGRDWYEDSDLVAREKTNQRDPTTAILNHGIKALGSARALAPGLRAFDSAGRNEIRVGKARFVFTKRKPSTKLPAPTVASIAQRTYAVGSETSATDITVTFATEVPPGAVAVVLYGINGKGLTTARTWARVVAGQTTVLVSRISEKPCAGNMGSPVGALPTAVGEQVEVGFVDQFGALSPPSARIGVMAAAAGPR